MLAAGYGDADARMISYNGDISTGAITVTASGDSADLDMDAFNGGITTGAITVTGTSGSASLSAYGDISTGAINVTGTSSSAYLNMNAGNNLATGTITIGGNYETSADLYAGTDITTGAISLVSGSSSGDVFMSAGDDVVINGGISVDRLTIYAGDTIAINGGAAPILVDNFTALYAPNQISLATAGAANITLGNFYAGGSEGPRPAIQINAGGNLAIGDFTIFGDVISLTAGGTVSDNGAYGGSINANALGVAAGTAINMLPTVFNIGTGVAPFGADAGVDSQMNLAGLTPPTSVTPNAAFSAPTVNIEAGNLTMAGDHLYLRANSLNLGTGMATVPTTVLVHYQPHTANLPIRLYNDLSGVTPQTGALYLGDVQHFQRFPGTTHFFGGTGYGGAIQVSPDGAPVTHTNSTNFVFLTFGPLIGADTIVTDGTVFPLFTVTDFQPVDSEYDPSDGGSGKRKSGGGEGVEGTVDGADAGEVQQQTNADVSGECKS